MGVKQEPAGSLRLIEHGEEQSWRVTHASLSAREPEGRTYKEVRDGMSAVHLSVSTKAHEEDEHDRAPSLSIGPLYVKIRSEGDLGPRRLDLRDGYDETFEEHVATLYVFHHGTLGTTTITVGPIRDGKASVQVEAATEDTNYYDERAKPGRLLVDATFDVEVTLPEGLPDKPPPVGPRRVEQRPKVVTIWMAEEASIRQMDRYMMPIGSLLRRRSAFAADCGLKRIGGDRLDWRCHWGRADLEDAFSEISVAVDEDWIRRGVEAARKAGLRGATAWIALEDYAACGEPWPEDAPVRFVGTFPMP